MQIRPKMPPVNMLNRALILFYSIRMTYKPPSSWKIILNAPKVANRPKVMVIGIAYIAFETKLKKT